MSTRKIAITLKEGLLRKIDRWVSEGLYPSRSRVIQETLEKRMANWRRKRLIEEVSKLNPKEERTIAEEGISAGNEVWDEY